jgi:steroid 5-alpha reductase family enzyme
MIGNALLVSAVAIAVLMVSTWVVSVAVKNASIVDIVWGSGFVVVAWVNLIAIDGENSRQWLMAILVSVWGLRLSTYLFRRNHGKGEDFRYVSMRKRWGNRFPVVSLVTVFLLQGTIMWIVSLPIQIGGADTTVAVGPIAVMGVMVWLLGVLFESVGDSQLRKFKSDPNNQGKVMDQGLWALTRHPNYFGDSMVWWGLGIVAAESGKGYISFVGPIVMMFFLTKVSGVAMLERSLAKRKPGYAAYMERTSSFWPRPPKRSAEN